MSETTTPTGGSNKQEITVKTTAESLEKYTGAQICCAEFEPQEEITISRPQKETKNKDGNNGDTSTEGGTTEGTNGKKEIDKPQGALIVGNSMVASIKDFELENDEKTISRAVKNGTRRTIEEQTNKENDGASLDK